MDISDIYFSANEQLRLVDLVPVTKKVYKEINKVYWDEEHQQLSYEKWSALLKEHGYDVKRIKKNKNKSSRKQFFYEGDYFTVEIQALDPSWLLNELTIGCLKVNDVQKESFLNKEYTLFFFPEWNGFAIDYFIRLYKEVEVDTDQLWDVFQTMYTHANYGFEMFPEELLEDVFTYANNTSSKDALREIRALDEEGYITVYRGEGERSTPIEKAYSWSIDKDIAYKLANHFKIGRVYKGRVKVENIIDYYDGRNEKEILVRYKDVENIEIQQDYENE